MAVCSLISEYQQYGSQHRHTHRARQDPEGTSPPVSDPGPLHMPYSVLKAPQDTVPWPEPYETLDNDNTYTPFLKK